MNTLRLRLATTSACAASLAVGLCLLSGCGDDTGLGKRYPVYGTVTYKDSPVEAGRISFIPANSKDQNQRAAAGDIRNGSYSLTTQIEGDGALPGEYNVTIVSKLVDDSKVKETIQKYGGGGRQEDVGRASAQAKNLIPGKYQLPETSKLTVTVKESSNKFDFPLKDD
jgi:hypothetical protein